MLSRLSLGERDRRWTALSLAMRAQTYDALIFAGHDHRGHKGALRYVADYNLYHRHGYAAMLPDAAPVLILPAIMADLPRSTWVEDRRHVAEPISGVVAWLSALPAEARVGIVGMKQVMRAGDYLYLTQARPDLRIADATALFDAVRRIKSAVEIEGLEEAAAIADICFKALLDTARPGETERQIGARMGELCQRLGGEDSLFLTMNSERRGDASHVAMSPPRGRVLDAANPLTFSFEMIGPSGYWTEMCRMISFGPPSQALTETVAAGCAAMSAGCAAMRPGAQAWDIQRSAAAAIDPGRHDLSGWNGHSIGQDVIEPPIVGPPPEAGAAPLAANMALAFHPLLVDRLEGPVFYMANIFVVGDHAARALSRWPQELYVRSA